MDITLSFSDDEFARVAAACKATHRITGEDSKAVAATAYEWLRGLTIEHEKQVAAKSAVEVAVAKASTEILPQKGLDAHREETKPKQESDSDQADAEPAKR